MKGKKLLLLAVLPLMLASCGSAEFNMYDQNIHYDSIKDDWDAVYPSINKTIKTVFNEYFNKIDWNHKQTSKLSKHSTVEEAMKCMSDSVAKAASEQCSKITIVTGSKGSDPKVCGATVTGQNGTKYDTHFTLDGTSTQQEYIFLDKSENEVCRLFYSKSYNHSIQISALAWAQEPFKWAFDFVTTEPYTSEGHNLIQVTFTANFVS